MIGNRGANVEQIDVEVAVCWAPGIRILGWRNLRPRVPPTHPKSVGPKQSADQFSSYSTLTESVTYKWLSAPNPQLDGKLWVTICNTFVPRNPQQGMPVYNAVSLHLQNEIPD